MRLIQPNRNSLDLDELPPFPWLYPYQEDGPRLGSIVHRPVVPVALVGSDVSSTVYALVDSGYSHVLAAPWLADAAGIDPKASGRRILLGIGGMSVTVEFADACLRLMAQAMPEMTSSSNGKRRSDFCSNGDPRGRC